MVARSTLVGVVELQQVMVVLFNLIDELGRPELRTVIAVRLQHVLDKRAVVLHLDAHQTCGERDRIHIDFVYDVRQLLIVRVVVSGNGKRTLILNLRDGHIDRNARGPRNFALNFFVDFVVLHLNTEHCGQRCDQRVHVLLPLLYIKY